MAGAETSNALPSKALFRREWRPLFPAEWVNQAFDEGFRTKRLHELREGQVTVAEYYHLQVWFIIGAVLCFLILQIWPSTKELFSDLTPILWLGSLVVAANLVVAAVKFVQTEFERTLLQIIDRVESEDARHE